MKYIQFHPTALYEPNNSQAFLITEAIRGFGAYIRNSKGERFLLKIHPQGELATRDIISKAISDEMKKENTKHVWLDIRHLSQEEFQEKFPKVYTYCIEKGFDLAKDLLPIAPAAHYQCGGIVVNEVGATNKSQLYAIGECSHTGLHGANRLASNSLIEAIVYSHDLATHLVSVVPNSSIAILENSDLKYRNIHHDEILQFRNQLQQFMNYDSLYGEKADIIKTYQLVSEMQKRFLMKFKNYDCHPFLCESYNMIQTALLIMREALPSSYQRKRTQIKTTSKS
jgi:L-aspartate oxidase